MLINEVIVTESYDDELIAAVRDLLTRFMAKDIKKINTEKFRSILAKQGFVTGTEELIQAIDKSGFASSVDTNQIVPSNQLSTDVNTAEADPDYVSDMASGQALADIKADI